MRFEVDYSTFVKRESREPLTDGTKKIYRAALNRLAAVGYSDKASLISNQSAIVKHIETTAKDNQHRRVFLSAIFKVLSDVDLSLKQEYYEAFQRAKPEAIKGSL